jgi:hypothetical protein
MATLGHRRHHAGSVFLGVMHRTTSNATEQTMPEDEPLSGTSPGASRFLIGKDSHGRWVAQDQRGLCGGLFISRAEAMRFAMFENGRRPQAVIMVPGIIELDMTRSAKAIQRQTQCCAA